MKNDFSLQSVVTHEQVRELINQFEPNIALQDTGRLSLNGLYKSFSDYFIINILFRF